MNASGRHYSDHYLVQHYLVQHYLGPTLVGAGCCWTSMNAFVAKALASTTCVSSAIILASSAFACPFPCTCLYTCPCTHPCTCLLYMFQRLRALAISCSVHIALGLGSSWPHRYRRHPATTSCHHILPPHPCQSDLHLLSIGVASLGGVWLVGALRHVDLCVESGLKFSDLGLDVDERLRAKSHRATIGTNSDLGFGAVFGMSNDQLG